MITMHGRARIFIEHLPIYLLSIVHSVSSCLVSICEYMLFGQANGLRACHPSIPRLNRPALNDARLLIDCQQCSTHHDQRRLTVYPPALAAASSTRTHLPLQLTTALIHGAPLRPPLHRQAKFHPSSPTLSVRIISSKYTYIHVYL